MLSMLGALAGCSLLDHQKTDYTITGIDGLDDTQAYAQKILDNRLATPIEEEQGSDDFARAETYREAMLENDLVKAMRARGYYDAAVIYRDDPQPLTGTFDIKPGKLYHLSSVRIEQSGDEHDISHVTLPQKGDVINAVEILKTQAALFKQVQKKGCYFSLTVDHSLVLDRASKTGDLVFHLNTGPQATLGAVNFRGNETVESDYLSKMVPWTEGDCFKHASVETLKTNLLETGLFSRAESTLPEKVNEGAQVPVELDLKERDHKTVKAGVNYYTDTGAGIHLGWQHRNILGAGENLDVAIDANQLGYDINGDLNKPYFLRDDQDLTISAGLNQEDSDAFTETKLDTGAIVSRDITDDLSVSGGVKFALAEIEDENINSSGTETYGLLSTPWTLEYDKRNDVLDPRKGYMLTASAEPFFDMLGEASPFVKVQGGARTYLEVTQDPGLVWAMRLNTGSLFGDSSLDIPASYRYYAGGSGSVRGFGYQEVGPFENGDPVGGRSYVTASQELRYKFSPEMGAVAFVDMGSVSATATPDLSNFAIGAGAGFRYYTDFGPIRFDVAVPLNEKENLDRNFQFYVSIGQAF